MKVVVANYTYFYSLLKKALRIQKAIPRQKNRRATVPMMMAIVFPSTGDMRKATKIRKTAILMYSFLEPIWEKSCLYSYMDWKTYIEEDQKVRN